MIGEAIPYDLYTGIQGAGIHAILTRYTHAHTPARTSMRHVMHIHTVYRMETSLTTVCTRRMMYDIYGIYIQYIYEGDVSANSAPPKNVENIEIVKTASRQVWLSNY